MKIEILSNIIQSDLSNQNNNNNDNNNSNNSRFMSLTDLAHKAAVTTSGAGNINA